MIGVEVRVRWRRDDRQQPDDLPAEEWLKEFRPVRPDALTAADKDAERSPAPQVPEARRLARPGSEQSYDSASGRAEPASYRGPASYEDPGRYASPGRQPQPGRFAEPQGFGPERYAELGRYAGQGRQSESRDESEPRRLAEPGGFGPGRYAGQGRQSESRDRSEPRGLAEPGGFGPGRYAGQGRQSEPRGVAEPEGFEPGRYAGQGRQSESRDQSEPGGFAEPVGNRRPPEGYRPPVTERPPPGYRDPAGPGLPVTYGASSADDRTPDRGGGGGAQDSSRRQANRLPADPPQTNRPQPNLTGRSPESVARGPLPGRAGGRDRNPRQRDPRQRGSGDWRAEFPGADGPGADGPGADGPGADVSGAEPRGAGVRAGDARHTDGRHTDARLPDGRPTDPRLPDGRLTDPRLPDGRHTGERQPDVRQPDLRGYSADRGDAARQGLGDGGLQRRWTAEQYPARDREGFWQGDGREDHDGDPLRQGGRRRPAQDRGFWRGLGADPSRRERSRTEGDYLPQGEADDRTGANDVHHDRPGGEPPDYRYRDANGANAGGSYGRRPAADGWPYAPPRPPGAVRRPDPRRPDDVRYPGRPVEPGHDEVPADAQWSPGSPGRSTWPAPYGGSRPEPGRDLQRQPGRDMRPPGESEPQSDVVPSSEDVLNLAQHVADLLAAAQGRSPADGTSPVSFRDDQAERTAQSADDRDDDTITSPMPVILPGATSVPRPAPVEAPRGPFEPARPSPKGADGSMAAGPAGMLTEPAGMLTEPPGRPGPLRDRPISVTGSVPPPPAASAGVVRPPQRLMPEAAEKKLDQLKDLYMTAEAIGEDALGKHFEQVSERQQELIREFFQQAEPEGPAAAGP